MRTIWVTSVSPCPPTDGNRQRHLQLLTRLAADHDVTLVCPVGNGEAAAAQSLREVGVEVVAVPDPPPPTGRARRYARRVATSARRRPDCLVPSAIGAMAEAVRRAAAQAPFDVAFGHLAAAPAVLAAGTAAAVIDDANVEADAYGLFMATEPRRLRRAARFADWRQVGAWERRWLRRARAVTVCSAGDAERLGELVPGLPDTHLVPNGVDLEAVAFHEGPREPATVLFVGGMAYAPNTDAALRLARDVMPRVWRQRPEARLVLAGKDPPAEVRALAGPRVEVTGEVPSVRPHLDRATLTVVALRAGGGTRLKILEAMAAGVPVVSTALGAQGLGFADGAEARIADSDEDLARATTALLDDPAAARALARRARARVEERFGWDRIAPRLESALETARAG